MIIRLFEPRDEQALRELLHRSCAPAHPFAPQEHWQRAADKLSRLLPKAKTYLCEEEGSIQAFACVLEGSYLHLVCVSPDLWRQGVGTALMQHLQGLFPRLMLTVCCENEGAVSFFEKHSFIAIEEQESDFDGHNEYIMKWGLL